MDMHKQAASQGMPQGLPQSLPQSLPMTIRFEGSITLEEPFTTSDPGAIEVEQDGGKMKLLGKMGDRYALRGSALRGVLRLSACAWAADAMGASGSTMRLDDFFLNAIGGVRRGTGKAGSDPNAEAEAAAAICARNPIAALFGTGDPFLMGKVTVGMGLDKNETPIKSITQPIVRRDHITGAGTIGALVLPPSEVGKWAALRTATKASIAADKAKIEAGGMRADDKSGAVSVQQIHRIQALPEGSVFAHRMELSNVLPHELGMFLQAMARFAERPRIGGSAARGYGRISLCYDVKIRRGRDFDAKWELLERIEIRDDFLARPSHPILADAIAENERRAAEYDFTAPNATESDERRAGNDVGSSDTGGAGADGTGAHAAGKATGGPGRGRRKAA